MPYPTEHAARVRDPDSFEPNSFRSKELKDGVRLILGKLKNGNGSMVVQAYRFPIDNFTAEQAKQWLEDNKIKYVKFEPAKSVSETGGIMNNKIEHTGVKGMRWGQRHPVLPDGTRRGIRGETAGKYLKKKDTASSTKKHSEDAKAIAEIKKKKIHEMSNEEIAKVTKRMDLEKRYKDLNPSKAAKGKKAAKGILSTIGTVAGTAGSIAALAGIGATLYKKVTDNMNIGAAVAKGLNPLH